MSSPPPTPTCILAFDLDAYVSGGQNSFIVLLRELANVEEYKVLALCPRGALADAFSAAGIPHIATTRTLRAARLGGGQATTAARDVVRSARTVNAVARACGADLIHANSVRAGVVALIANLMGGPPVVVHVRDHFRASLTARLARAFVLFRAAGVIAVSQYTARRFELPGFQKVRPIHNAIDPLAFIPSGPRGRWRHRLGDDADGRVVIGIVAQLTPWKAQDDAIRILRGLRDRGIDAVLWIVGEAKAPTHMSDVDPNSFAVKLVQLANDLQVSDTVRFMGEQKAIPDILADMDIVLIPSWEEPLARTMLEAMAIGTPVAVSSRSGMGEVITHGQTGLLLQPKQPQAWTEAIASLLNDSRRMTTMAEEAKAVVSSRLTPHHHAHEVASMYKAILRCRTT